MPEPPIDRFQNNGDNFSRLEFFAGGDIDGFQNNASGVAEIDHHAEALREFVENLPGQPKLAFVGHSLGNIVVRRALGLWKENDDRQVLPRLQRVVMLGPPNQGSALAKQLSGLGLFEVLTGTSGQELGAVWQDFQAKLATPACPFCIIAGELLIFCPGGLSHVDTWDYRPELERLHGRAFDAELGKQTFAGVAGEYAKSFWQFRQHGQCGRWMSDLFPKLAGHVDDMAMIIDRDTGRSKGFGFVEMSNQQEANAAMAGLNGKDNDGRSLQVNEAKPREDRGSSYQGSGSGGGGGGSGRPRRDRW